jgi:hypothetical protein
MKCPHCNTGIHDNLQRGHHFIAGEGPVWLIEHQNCPECDKSIIFLEGIQPTNRQVTRIIQTVPRFMAYPPRAPARPLPREVPDPYKRDFDEAVAVLPISPKASAALSRRNLQAIIHNKAGVKGRDLNAEIETLIASGTLPSHISEGLHAVRAIGNFAAHPTKATSTGAIVDVEVGEAEWNLDVLESLFDFYFVEPTKAAQRKAALNKKLKEAGKPPI